MPETTVRTWACFACDKPAPYQCRKKGWLVRKLTSGVNEVYCPEHAGADLPPLPAGPQANEEPPEQEPRVYVTPKEWGLC